LYINDIVLQFPHVQCKMFADDVKLFVTLNHNDSMGSYLLLQNALDSLVKWSNTWQLEISAPKCSILHLGKHNPEFEYFIDNNAVKSVDQCKDLGVQISRDLKPSTHCNIIATKAYRIINMLFRCFINCNVQMLLQCYVSYVRPILEYSSTVWSPCLMRDIDKIESVQRYFTRRLFARAHLSECSYKNRLDYLKLAPLELRRLKYDLVMVFKCLKTEISACQNIFKLSHNQNTRGHELKLLKPKFHCQTLEHSFFVRIIDIWNSLPVPLVNATNSVTFKKSLDKSHWGFNPIAFRKLLSAIWLQLVLYFRFCCLIT
jgi:hypothetical protein